MKQSKLLILDALINLGLGLLLIFYSRSVVDFLGVPWTNQAFYPNILGGVLFGIGVALLLEFRRQSDGPVGLGLAGAVAINLSGGLVLLGWLLWGELNLGIRGLVFLWGLAFLLVALSGAELASHIWKKA
jgi:hypothetical protein